MVEKFGVSFDQKSTSKVSLISGNCAYRRETLKKVGLFDTKLKGLEDIDLGIRVKLAGYELNFTPNAVVYHRNYKTIRQLVKRKYIEGLQLASLSRKYVYHFNFGRYLVIFLFRTLRHLVSTLFRMTKSRHFTETQYKNIFGILTLTFTTVGFVKGYFSVKYEGSKVEEKIKFLE